MSLIELEVLSYDGLRLRGFLHKSQSNLNQTIIFTHGISEYGLRHDYLITQLGSRYNIIFHDLRGHGVSEGERGHIRYFQDFEKDLATWINYVVCNDEIQTIDGLSLMGHSMGGLITLGVFESCSIKQYINKIFLSAPAIGVGDPLGTFLQKYVPSWLIGLSGKLLHKIALKSRVDANQLSHEPSLKKVYENDPMILSKLSARLLTQLLIRSSSISRYKLQIDKPTKVVVGSSDLVISVSRIEDFINNHKSLSKIELTLIDKALHEMHFEIEKYKKQYFIELNSFFS